MLGWLMTKLVPNLSFHWLALCGRPNESGSITSHHLAILLWAQWIYDTNYNAGTWRDVSTLTTKNPCTFHPYHRVTSKGHKLLLHLALDALYLSTCFQCSVMAPYCHNCSLLPQLLLFLQSHPWIHRNLLSTLWFVNRRTEDPEGEDYRALDSR